MSTTRQCHFFPVSGLHYSSEREERGKKVNVLRDVVLKGGRGGGGEGWCSWGEGCWGAVYVRSRKGRRVGKGIGGVIGEGRIRKWLNRRGRRRLM